MPLANSPYYTAVDIETQMIAYLQADAHIQAFLLNSVGAVNTILDDDPKPELIDPTENTRLVFTLAQDGWSDATTGRESGGTVNVINQFAVLLYVYDGLNRNPVNARHLKQWTQELKMALYRYSQGQGTPAGASGSTQLWYSLDFPPLTTKYVTPKNCRISATMVNLYSRIGFN